MKYHGGLRKDCKKRLDIIRQHALFGSLLDIGCSEGYYSFRLADVADSIVAIDNVAKLILDCEKNRMQQGLKNIRFMTYGIVDFLNEELNNFDTILYMSVHHHIISQYGLDVASAVLRLISTRCDGSMFFDMGQKDENCPQHNWWHQLPSNDNQKQWLKHYLHNNTVFNKIENIGFTNIHGTKRLLWKLDR